MVKKNSIKNMVSDNKEANKDEFLKFGHEIGIFPAPKVPHTYVYDKINGYNHIILKYFICAAINAINFPESYVRDWVNNGFEIRGYGLFVEIEPKERRRLKGINLQAVVYYNVLISDENDDGELQREIKGIFEIFEYDKIAECIAKSLFQNALDEQIQKAILNLDGMKDYKNIELEEIDSIQSIEEFVIDDEERQFKQQVIDEEHNKID